jgi:sodium-dependent dicarboxylate transporter 2/3/5
MSYFHLLGHPMNLKRCLSFLAVCAVSLFLAFVPTTFFGSYPLTGEPIFTLTQQRVIAIFVFTALMWILEVIPTWTTSVVAIVSILLTTSNKGLGFLMEKENVGSLTNYKDVMASFADPVIMLSWADSFWHLLRPRLVLMCSLQRYCSSRLARTLRLCSWDCCL